MEGFCCANGGFVLHGRHPRGRVTAGCGHRPGRIACGTKGRGVDAMLQSVAWGAECRQGIEKCERKHLLGCCKVSRMMHCRGAGDGEARWAVGMVGMAWARNRR